nr:unnamed protein product [Callosobruchus chinensis]
MPRNELSAYRIQIIALWQKGSSRHQIANRLNVVRSTLSRTIAMKRLGKDLDRNNPTKSFGVRIEVQKAFEGAFFNCSSPYCSIAVGKSSSRLVIATMEERAFLR